MDLYYNTLIQNIHISINSEGVYSLWGYVNPKIPAVSRYVHTAEQAKLHWPKQCSSTTAISPEWAVSRTATQSAISSQRNRKAISHFPPQTAKRKGKTFFVLDAPGCADFTGEMSAAIRVADTAVILVSSAGGIEVQTYVLPAVREISGFFCKFCQHRPHEA